MTEPLVVLPAFMCDVRLFWPVMPALARDRAVIVPPLTGAERVEDLASQVLSALPGRVALWGVGFGGIVAMDVLRRAPERVGRIMLMDTTPLPESPQAAAAREPQMIAARAGRLTEMVTQAGPGQALAAGPGRLSVQAALREMSEDLGADVFVRQSRALQRRKDQQATLRKVRQPAWVVCGAQDGLYSPKRHHFMAELIEGAQLEVIESAGHLPPLEQPDEVLRIVRDWLAA